MMLLLVTIAIALLWCLLSGALTLSNLVVGMLVGGVVLLAARQAVPVVGAQLALIPRFGALVTLVIWDLVASSVQVAIDVVTSGNRFRPRIVALPLRLQDDAVITVLSQLITFTPGTLTLDVAEDRSVLFVHAMYAEDEAAVIAQLDRLQRRLVAVWYSGDAVPTARPPPGDAP